MSDTKLDPATLSAEERAIVDHEASRFHRDWSGEARYKSALSICEPHILARRALFAPATEKNECVLHEEIVRDGPSKWTCETHPQPEPAAPVNGSTPVGEYDPDMKPAATEMPEAVQLALDSLRSSSQRDEEDGEPIRADILRRRAGDLESWWRTHSQPVAVGMTEEPEARMAMAKAGVEKSNDRYSYASHEWKMGFRVGWIDGNDYAVRQQAAQGKPKVELPKVREGK